MKRYCLFLLSGITIVGCQVNPEKKVTEAANNTDSKIVTERKITIPETVNTGSAVYAAAALNFVNGYVDTADKLKSIDEIGEWVAENPNVTANYKQTIKNEINDINNDPETILDADIIFDAQDYPDEGFELESVDQKSGHVVLRGKKWKDFKLNVKLAQENGKWLVDESGDF